MRAAAVAGFLVAIFPLVATPGASFTLLVREVTAAGRRRAVPVILGTVSGLCVHATQGEERRRPAQSATDSMTSDALMIAMTSLPGASFSSLAASTVIEATSRDPPASSSMLAVASPAVMPVTVAGIWLRALSFMNDSPVLLGS
jgi:hypothetical protein